MRSMETRDLKCREDSKLNYDKWRLGLFIILFFLINILPLSSLANSNDFDVIRAEMEVDILAGGSGNRAGAYRNSILANGSWSDVNYNDRSRIDWDPLKHLTRIFAMAVAHNSVSHSLYQNTDLRNKILSAFDYWMTEDPQSDTWWYNQIATPRDIAKVMVIMKPYLSASQIVDGRRVVRRGMPDLSSNPSGTDPLKKALTTSHLAIVTEDNELLRSMLDFVASGVKIKIYDGTESKLIDYAGIQADMTYHYHGTLIYNLGSYGSSYLSNVGDFMKYVKGTQFDYDQSKKDLMVDHILEGSQWFVRKNRRDYSAMGRDLVRGNKNAQSQVSYARKYAIINPSRAVALSNYADRINGTGPDLIGNRDFWRSDMMAHHRSDYAITLKMYSPRTTGTEVVNLENRKGFHQPDGVTNIYQHGNEIQKGTRDLLPVMNWRRLPGITAEQATGDLPSANPTGAAIYFRGYRQFVGGVSDGLYGAAGYDFLKKEAKTGANTVLAKKAYFFFNNEMVCLGAGIKGLRNFPINTAINQTFLINNVVVGHSDGTTNSYGIGTERILTAPEWVIHDKVGYVIPGNENLNLLAKIQSGRFSDIAANRPDDIVSEKLFSLWIDHGTKPDAESYYYIVVPDSTQSSINAYSQNNPITVIKNTSSVQAVRHSVLGVTGIIFYAAETVLIKPGLTISADAKVMLLVTENGKEITVSASDPRWDVGASTSVTVNGVSKTYTFPMGVFGGKSIKKTYMAGGQASMHLIEKGSSWKYLDNGSNQGTAWQAPGFDDSAWARGTAQLGYGDGDEATVVSFGPNSSSKYTTTYFRHTFNLADASQVTALNLELLRDDGAVVYLNGTEIIRSNMPQNGTISYTTLATAAESGAGESTYYAFAIPPALLVTGSNTLAVEVHQYSRSSSDMSFDAALTTTPSVIFADSFE